MPGVAERRSPRRSHARPACAGTTATAAHPRPSARSPAQRPVRPRPLRAGCRSRQTAWLRSPVRPAPPQPAIPPARPGRAGRPARAPRRGRSGGTSISARCRRTHSPSRRVRSARSCISRTVSSTASGRPSVRSCRNAAKPFETCSPSSIDDTRLRRSRPRRAHRDSADAATRTGGRPRGQPQQQRVGGHVLGSVRHHQVGRRTWREVSRSRNSSVASSAQCTSSTTSTATSRQSSSSISAREQPMPGGLHVLGGLRRRGQIGRPLREQRPQRTGERADRQPAHAVRGLPHGVDDRTRACTAGETAGTPPPVSGPSADNGRGGELLHQAGSCRCPPHPRRAPAAACCVCACSRTASSSARPTKPGDEIIGSRAAACPVGRAAIPDAPYA